MSLFLYYVPKLFHLILLYKYKHNKSSYWPIIDKINVFFYLKKSVMKFLSSFVKMIVFSFNDVATRHPFYQLILNKRKRVREWMS